MLVCSIQQEMQMLEIEEVVRIVEFLKNVF